MSDINNKTEDATIVVEEGSEPVITMSPTVVETKKTPKRTPSKRRTFIERAQEESEELVRNMGGSLELEGGRRTRSSTRGTPLRAPTASAIPPPNKKARSSPLGPPTTPKSTPRGRGRKNINAMVTAEEETISKLEVDQGVVEAGKVEEDAVANSADSVKEDNCAKNTEEDTADAKQADDLLEPQIQTSEPSTNDAANDIKISPVQKEEPKQNNIDCEQKVEVKSVVDVQTADIDTPKMDVETSMETEQISEQPVKTAAVISNSDANDSINTNPLTPSSTPALENVSSEEPSIIPKSDAVGAANKELTPEPMEIEAETNNHSEDTTEAATTLEASSDIAQIADPEPVAEKVETIDAPGIETEANEAVKAVEFVQKESITTNSDPVLQNDSEINEVATSTSNIIAEEEHDKQNTSLPVDVSVAGETLSVKEVTISVTPGDSLAVQEVIVSVENKKRETSEICESKLANSANNEGEDNLVTPQACT